MHLGIILDGNRRWAKERHLPAIVGHKKGKETAEKVIEWCRKKGVKTLSLFVFSTENWQRSKREVDFLLKLLEEAMSPKSLEKFNKNGIRIKMIGLRNNFPASLKKKIEEAENSTKNNKAMTVNFALSYGGRAEIVEAVKKIIEKGIKPESLTEEMVGDFLWTSDVDLIIRTGKEQRLSNFLIWQAAYSEFYFSPKYWPDFSEKDLDEALEEFSRRQRRFGK